MEIIIRVQESALNECLCLACAVTGQTLDPMMTLEERTNELGRLSGIILGRYGYIPFNHDVDRFSTDGTGVARILPIPTDTLLNHCAALNAGETDWNVQRMDNVVHG